jgi:hypothetical protein
MLHPKLSRPWMNRAVRLLHLVFVFSLGARVNGQEPSESGLPKKTYLKKGTIHLPVQMDERVLANLKEIRLYVKDGNGEWVRHETGAPTQSHFSFKAPHDGEYWFSLETIDKTGRAFPPDFIKEPPGLRVVVDSVAPEVDIKISTTPEGERCLSCHVRDANPDLQSVKATYRDDAGEHELEITRSNPVIFKIAGLRIPNQKIVVTAADLSGNTVRRDVNLGELLASFQQTDSNTPQPTDQVRQVEFSPPPPSPSARNGILRRLAQKLAR